MSSPRYCVAYLCALSAVLLIGNVILLSTNTDPETSRAFDNSATRSQEFTRSLHVTDSTQKQQQRLGAPPNDNLLPLHKLLSETDDSESGILQDVSFLLDIAVLGHAKCGTSYIMDWLSDHPEIQMFEREVCDLYDRKPAKLARRLFTELPANNETHTYKRGWKCPGHFSTSSLPLFKYFPRTKLIVGLRHPVRYFESYYNFRFRHPQHNETMPPAETLIGKCTENSQGVCTEYAKFHVNLAKFGKTNFMDPDQQELLQLDGRYKNRIERIPNELFLYDMTQLKDDNTNRTAQFMTDLQHFLQLKSPLTTKKHQQRSKLRSIDICESKYDELRTELVDIGKRASEWILSYLLPAETVKVSNPDHFSTILKTWKSDPCRQR